MSAPEGYAPVKKDGTPGKLQKKVPFAHDKHAAIDCAACHHQPADGKTYASCNSAGCHENMDSKTGADSFYAAFHAANSDKSCLGCHKGLQKDKKPTGPTACGKCHTDC
ncbi:MAG: cytochrome C [Deltaproteobacteria bacterium]|nr:cytochrome C [Deltaproteobacteria bacterium]